jgi:hypothetical protein
MNDRDEWRRDVARMTEIDRQLAVDEPRQAIGIVGDREDARDE